MGALFDPFKERQNRAMELTIGVPIEEPGKGNEGDKDYVAPVHSEFELKVRRLPPALIHNATVDGEGKTRRRGLDDSHPLFGTQRMLDTYFHLAEQMKGHVVGGRNLDGSESPNWTPSTYAAWLDMQTPRMWVEIGKAYWNAHWDDEKKTTPQPSSDQASSKPSANDSSTS